MAVQFSAALLLEVGWRKSILSETFLQMMPPPIVMASRELHDLHDLHEGGAMLEEDFKAVLNSTLANRVKSKQSSEEDLQRVKAVLDSMLAKKVKSMLVEGKVRRIEEKYLLRRTYGGSKPCSTLCSNPCS